MPIASALLAMTAMSACSAPDPNSQQAPPNNERGAIAIAPPAGVPADGTLLPAMKLRQLMVGSLFGPKDKSAILAEPLEFISPDGWWAKAPFPNAFSPTPTFSYRLLWRDHDFCVTIQRFKRCSQVWVTSDQRLFIHHIINNNSSKPTVFELKFYGPNTVFRAPGAEWKER
jgi:hypothetical protein